MTVLDQILIQELHHIFLVGKDIEPDVRAKSQADDSGNSATELKNRGLAIKDVMLEEWVDCGRDP